MVEKKSTTLLRKPYYQVQDGLWNLNHAIDELLDEELLAQLRNIREKMFEFETAMNKKYNWD